MNTQQTEIRSQKSVWVIALGLVVSFLGAVILGTAFTLFAIAYAACTLLVHPLRVLTYLSNSDPWTARIILWAAILLTLKHLLAA